jgi:LPS-assembly lipoprotein
MRKVFGALALCAVFGVSALGLGGCGFAPLYAKTGMTANMAQIDIRVPETRTGYFLEQNLHNSLGIDDSAPKTYRLAITMKESHYSVGYQVDDTSTRSEITSAVSYVLKDQATGRTLYDNSFSETVTYDTSKSPFTGVIAQQDGQERIASAISEQIQRDLALYFHGDLLPVKSPTSTPAIESTVGNTGSGMIKETEITPANR